MIQIDKEMIVDAFKTVAITGMIYALIVLLFLF